MEKYDIDNVSKKRYNKSIKKSQSLVWIAVLTSK